MIHPLVSWNNFRILPYVLCLIATRSYLAELLSVIADLNSASEPTHSAIDGSYLLYVKTALRKVALYLLGFFVRKNPNNTIKIIKSFN